MRCAAPAARGRPLGTSGPCELSALPPQTPAIWRKFHPGFGPRADILLCTCLHTQNIQPRPVFEKEHLCHKLQGFANFEHLATVYDTHIVGPTALPAAPSSASGVAGGSSVGAAPAVAGGGAAGAQQPNWTPTAPPPQLPPQPLPPAAAAGAAPPPPPPPAMGWRAVAPPQPPPAQWTPAAPPPPPAGSGWPTPPVIAVGETAILLHPPLHLVGVSTGARGDASDMTALSPPASRRRQCRAPRTRGSGGSTRRTGRRTPASVPPDRKRLPQTVSFEPSCKHVRQATAGSVRCYAMWCEHSCAHGVNMAVYAAAQAEFVAHYHGTVEWEAAAPVGQWCGENRKGTVLEQQESLPLRFCDRLLLDLGGFAQSLAARVLLTALRSMLLLSVCSLCSSPHKEVLVCM